MQTEADVEVLNIEVSSNWNDAPRKGIKSLVNYLKKLKTLETELHSDKFANFPGISKAIEKVSDALKPLAEMKNVSSVVNALKKLPNALSGYKEKDADAFVSCAKSVVSALETLDKPVNVGSLSTSLNRLAKTLSGYKEVDTDKFTDSIATVTSILPQINIENGIVPLQKLCTQLNKLPKTLEQFNSVDLTGFKTVYGEIQKMVNTMKQLNDIPNLKDFISAVKQLKSNKSKVATPTLNAPVIPEAPDLSPQLMKNMTLTEQLKEKFKQLPKIVGSAVSSCKSILKGLGRVTVSVLGKIGGALKTIGRRLLGTIMYRALSTAIREVTKAVKEGITNFYQYSKASNGAFSKAMDRIATSTLYVKNSFGALVGMVIQKVTPYLEVVFDKISACVNKISEFYAKLTGAGSWTRAKKVPVEFAEAADHAVTSTERLKRAILGFDKLNILDFGTQLEKASKVKAPSTPKYTTMFEEVRLVDNGSISNMSGKFDGLFTALEKCSTSLGEFFERLIPKGQLKETILDLALGTVGALIKGVANVIDLLNKLHVPDIFIVGLTTALGIVNGIAETIEVTTDIITHPKKFKENSKEYSKEMNRLIKLTETYAKFGTKSGYNDTQTKALFAAANKLTAHESAGALKEVLDELEKRIGSGLTYKTAGPTDDAKLVAIENQMNALTALYVSKDNENEKVMSYKEYKKALDSLASQRSQRIEIQSNISRSNFNEVQTYNAAINGY